MTTEQLIERFIAGATTGKASSLRIEGDTLYSYAYPLATRDASGAVTINTAPMGATITQANPEFEARLEEKAHRSRPGAYDYVEKRRETYYDATDAAYSRTTNKARRMVEYALQGR